MSETHNEPAFPACNEANVNGTMGMTLRDWFAGQALAGIMARMDQSGFAFGVNEDDWSCPVGDAYRIAGTMLQERAK